MRPEPTEVWLVREGDPRAEQGTMAIEGRSLTFAPADSDSAKVAIPIGGIKRARRRRGSPLLTLSYPTPEGERKLFVYFAKPPPLPQARTASPEAQLLRPRGLERAAAALTLRQTSRLVKREIDVWVRALRALGAEG